MATGGQENPPICQDCKSDILPSDSWKCLTCKITLLCDVCSTMHSKKEHEVVDSEGEDPVMCQKHDYVISSYCQECDHLICNRCLNQHLKHDVVPLSKFISSAKKFVWESLRISETQPKALEDMKKQLEEKLLHEQNNLEHLQDFRDEIITSFLETLDKKIGWDDLKRNVEQMEIENQLLEEEIKAIKENERINLTLISKPNCYFVKNKPNMRAVKKEREIVFQSSIPRYTIDANVNMKEMCEAMEKEIPGIAKFKEAKISSNDKMRAVDRKEYNDTVRIRCVARGELGMPPQTRYLINSNVGLFWGEYGSNVLHGKLSNEATYDDIKEHVNPKLDLSDYIGRYVFLNATQPGSIKRDLFVFAEELKGTKYNIHLFGHKREWTLMELEKDHLVTSIHIHQETGCVEVATRDFTGADISGLYRVKLYRFMPCECPREANQFQICDTCDYPFVLKGRPQEWKPCGIAVLLCHNRLAVFNSNVDKCDVYNKGDAEWTLNYKLDRKFNRTQKFNGQVITPNQDTHVLLGLVEAPCDEEGKYPYELLACSDTDESAVVTFQ